MGKLSADELESALSHPNAGVVVQAMRLADRRFQKKSGLLDATLALVKHTDPRVRFINDDGRNFLNITDRKYHLITSEPPPPLHPGIDRLFSTDYYESVRDHLVPGGMMAQWIPLYQLPDEAAELVVPHPINRLASRMLNFGLNVCGRLQIAGPDHHR